MKKIIWLWFTDTAIGQADARSFSVDGYSFDFYFQAIIAGNYMIKDVLSREVLEIDYLDQTRYNAKVSSLPVCVNCYWMDSDSQILFKCVLFVTQKRMLCFSWR